MPRTPDGVADDEAVCERTVIVRTVRTERETFLAPSHNDDFVIADVTADDCAVRQLSDRNTCLEVEAFLVCHGSSHRDDWRDCFQITPAARLRGEFRVPHGGGIVGRIVTFRVDKIDHVELFVPDRHQAAAWYEQVLGLTIVGGYEHWAADARGPLMISSDGGRTKLALFQGEPQAARATAGFHRVAFSVGAADFAKFLDRLPALALADHEGRIVTAVDVKDHTGAHSLYFCDPYGHRLELTTYEV